MPGSKVDLYHLQKQAAPPPAHMPSTPTHGSSHHSYHQSPHRGQEPVHSSSQHNQAQPQAQQQQAGQPVEFNHAINYVNKIKVRTPQDATSGTAATDQLLALLVETSRAYAIPCCLSVRPSVCPSVNNSCYRISSEAIYHRDFFIVPVC